MKLKLELLEHCHKALDQRLAGIQQMLSDLANSLHSETKSTAGDKHETGRAMLQLEREKLGAQLREAERQKAQLYRISSSASGGRIALGSLVQTSEAFYFLASSLGQIKIEGTSYFVISIGSPMGQLLLGKAEGEWLSFRGTEIQIIKVL